MSSSKRLDAPQIVTHYKPDLARAAKALLALLTRPENSDAPESRSGASTSIIDDLPEDRSSE